MFSNETSKVKLKENTDKERIKEEKGVETD